MGPDDAWSSAGSTDQLIQPSPWPDRVFRAALLARSSLIWLGVRSGLVILLLWVQQHPVFLAVPAAVGVVLSVMAVVWLDLRRRREHLLLANMGVGPVPLLFIAAVPPVVMELLVGLAGRL